MAGAGAVSAPEAALERVTGVPGVRGALLVSTADGLVVAERVMDDVDGFAVAALAGSLVTRLARTTDRAAMRAPAFVQLRGETGAVLAALAADDLVLVAVTSREANVGLARLEMLGAAEQLR